MVSDFEMKAFLCNLLVLPNPCVFCLCWVSSLSELQVFLQAPIHSSALKHEGQWRRCIIFEVGATLIAPPASLLCLTWGPDLQEAGGWPRPPHHPSCPVPVPITWWYVLLCPSPGGTYYHAHAHTHAPAHATTHLEPAYHPLNVAQYYVRPSKEVVQYCKNFTLQST